MTRPCGRVDCPVVDPDRFDLRRVRSVNVAARSVMWRGVSGDHPAAKFVPSLGNTRFAPLADVGHVYVSRTATAALLESALHHLSGPDPTIYLVELERWRLAQVSLRSNVRLVDLRDNELARLGIDRTALVDTTPMHYGCTRQWAAALHARSVGGRPTEGIMWHSRQADMHARAHRGGVLGDLLTHRQIEVAVLYDPPAHRLLKPLGQPKRLVDDAGVDQLILELSALLRAPIE